MFEAAMFLELMEKLCKRCHEMSKSKGFWEGPEQSNIPTKLALIHSEISEALEAHREGKPISKKLNRKVPDEYVKGDGYNGCGYVHPVNEHAEPISLFAEELADAVIRIADLCGHLGIDLGDAIRHKISYNASRPYKHGKAY